MRKTEITPAVGRGKLWENSVLLSKHLSYKMLEIDNGAILTAPLDKFNDCFQEQVLENSNIRTFKTSGKVINEKLKKNK